VCRVLAWRCARARSLSGVSLPVRLGHADARRHAALVFALGAENISVVMAVSPATLVLLGETVRDQAESLLADVETGSLANAPNLDSAWRRRLESRLPALPERARRLREQMKADGGLCPATAWPRLAAIATWQGGSAPFYGARLPELWGDAPQRCLGLRASEGTFTIPTADRSASGVLGVTGHVVEFLPGEDAPRLDSTTLLPSELEIGKRYRMVITTSGGLYRYDLGDVVEATGFRERTPELAFLHRAGAVLSIAGEKVTEDQVTAAMRLPALDFPRLAGFTVTLEQTSPPRYILAVEWRGAPSSEPLPGELRRSLAAVLAAFDQNLSAANLEYAAKRADGRLAFPRLLLVAGGTYAARRARLLAEGRSEGQLKPLHLTPPAGLGRAPVAGCPFFDHAHVIATIG